MDTPIGRYIESDPIGLVGGINTFVYAGNSPVNLVDPWGLDALIYNLKDSTLYWLNDNGQVIGSWAAISGTKRYAHLPYGDYTLNKLPTLVPPTHPRQSAYCDPSGNCWWQPIVPNFSTNRTGLGIHPEGGKPGTEGCIGVKGSDTSSLYQKLQQYLKKFDLLPLRVE